MKKTFLILFFILLLSGCSINQADKNDNLNQAGNTANQNTQYENTTQIDETNKSTSTDTGVIEEKNMNENGTTTNETASSTVPNASDTSVLIETSKGNIKISLNKELAPVSVENFLKYVNEEFYNNTLFHRVIPSFMIQGGGFDTEGTQKTTHEPIKNEAKNGLLNKRGTIAMARTMVVDSATSQFFINLVDNSFLDYKDDTNYGYAVFGEVTEGMDVVDEIAKVKTGNKGAYSDWPTENVIIKNVKLLKE